MSLEGDFNMGVSIDNCRLVLPRFSQSGARASVAAPPPPFQGDDMNTDEAKNILCRIDSDGNPYGGNCPPGLTNFDGSLTDKGKQVVREAQKVLRGTKFDRKRFQYLFDQL